VNSAPFIQYAFARASNILKRSLDISKKIDYGQLESSTEHELVRKIAYFPEVFVEAVDKLSPSSLAEYSNELASTFNSFYASFPVLQAETSELRDARLTLVDAFRITLSNTMRLLNIDVLERM
jgi:arginyl-tRNA synthetase